MSKLRTIKKKKQDRIRPIFKSDESGQDEHSEGAVHTGSILVRNYIDNLDMDFYAGRASTSSKEHTEVVSVRLPGDLMKDIAIIIESGKSRFRDRSELVRSATFILVNYIANKLKAGVKDSFTLKEIEDFNRYEKQALDKLTKICDDFRNLFNEMARYGDVVLDKWISGNVERAKTQPNAFYRRKLLNAFWNIMMEHGVDPAQYIEQAELEVKESEEGEN